MNGTVNTGLVARALGQRPKTVLERAKREGWPCVRKSGGIRWVEKMLPMDVRLAVENRPADNDRQNGAAAASQDFYRATEKERQTAELRGTLIAECHTSGLVKESFIAAYNSNTEACLYKSLGHVSLRTFYRWEREFSRKGLGGLVPHYSAGSSGAGESLSDSEKALLERFWLRDSRPTIQHAFRLLKENYPGSVCSYQIAGGIYGVSHRIWLITAGWGAPPLQTNISRTWIRTSGSTKALTLWSPITTALTAW